MSVTIAHYKVVLSTCTFSAVNYFVVPPTNIGQHLYNCTHIASRREIIVYFSSLKGGGEGGKEGGRRGRGGERGKEGRREGGGRGREGGEGGMEEEEGERGTRLNMLGIKWNKPPIPILYRQFECN